MKKIIEYILITILFVISLIYTNKITNIVKSKDPIMKSIINASNNYKMESVNALVDDNEIVPGINGCDIDIDKSYENMKKINEYNDNMLKYKDLIPEITITNIYDKYIFKGNNFKRRVSLVVYIKYKVEEINKIEDIKLNVFLDSNILEDGKINISKNKYIYNGGSNLNYDDITIEWMNDIITNSYNTSNYCLNLNNNDNNLLVCARNKMHTINPKLIVNKSNTYDVKSSVQNGSIIYFDENNIDKINEISNYLIKKGYEMVYLDELLSEKRCEIK